MVELRVPKLVDSQFESYYRTLIRQSLLRSAEAEYVYHQRAGHGLRARRAARAIVRIQALLRDSGTATTLPRFGPGVLAATRIAWLVSAAALGAIALGLGLQSWATDAGDLWLIALTFVWFAVSWGSDVRPPD